MKLERYPCRDAARLSLRGGKLHRTVTVDDRTHVGLDPDGRALWVSLLSVSQGANLDLLTQEERHQARRLLGEIREDNAPAGRKCTGLNRTARKGSHRCTRDVTRTLRGLPTCTRHYNIQVRNLRVREWQEEDRIACPEHPDHILRINPRDRTLECTGTTPIGCGWVQEIPEPAWRGGPEWVGRHRPRRPE